MTEQDPVLGPKPAKVSNPYAVAFGIVGELAIEIAFPVVLLSVLGKYLDKRFETGPVFLIGGFVLAAVTSSVLIWKRIQAIKRMYTDTL